MTPKLASPLALLRPLPICVPTRFFIQENSQMLATAKVASAEGVVCGPWDQIMLLGLTLYNAFHTFASGLHRSPVCSRKSGSAAHFVEMRGGVTHPIPNA